MNKRKTPKANLENKRIIFLQIGLIITLAAVLYALEYKSFGRIIDLKEYYSNYKEDEELAPLIIKEKEVLPERPRPQTIINIVDDNIPIDNDIIIDVSIDANEGMEAWEPIEEPDEVDEEVIPSYMAAVQPEFPGGEAAMFRFLKENFKIPRIDRELGNQGKVYVAFVVDKDGNIKDVRIERSLSPSSDAEAIRVIRMMPQWSPGQQGIKKVAVSMIIPIHVKLM